VKGKGRGGEGREGRGRREERGMGACTHRNFRKSAPAFPKDFTAAPGFFRLDFGPSIGSQATFLASPGSLHPPLILWGLYKTL